MNFTINTPTYDRSPFFSFYSKYAQYKYTSTTVSYSGEEYNTSMNPRAILVSTYTHTVPTYFPTTPT